jgi:hypothetical protein
MEPHPYRQAFAARDLDRLVSLLADDAIFHSPLTRELGLEGHDAVAVFLPIALDVFKETEYTHDFGDEHSHVIVGDARVLGKPVKTTWLLELDAEGKIRDIWVMVRPLTGLVAIFEAVGLQAVGLREAEGDDESVSPEAVSALSKQLADLAALTDSGVAGVIGNINRSTANRRAVSSAARRTGR